MGAAVFWQITAFPKCDYHVFLSHCAQDRDGLVHPVDAELRRRRIIPWLDREDYYYGRDSRSALRYGLLKSRHVAFFVTLAMMDYRRGWCPMELAYADLLQGNLLYPGDPLLNVELPLFFLDSGDPEIMPHGLGGAAGSGAFLPSPWKRRRLGGRSDCCVLAPGASVGRGYGEGDRARQAHL